MSSIRNIGKHYVFHNDSWNEREACDCCEGPLVECYNCDEPELSSEGSAYSEESIIRQLAVVNNIITNSQYYECDVSIDQISKLLCDYGVTWEILDAGT